jgi:hypothetical protein
MRQNSHYTRSDLGTLGQGQARHETGEMHQVHNPEERSPLSHDDFGVRRGNVGPLRRNRANRPVIDAQQESLAGPVFPFTHAGERPAAERMEGMGYADKLRRSDGNVCIPN